MGALVTAACLNGRATLARNTLVPVELLRWEILDFLTTGDVNRFGLNNKKY